MQFVMNGLFKTVNAEPFIPYGLKISKQITKLIVLDDDCKLLSINSIAASKLLQKLSGFTTGMVATIVILTFVINLIL